MPEVAVAFCAETDSYRSLLEVRLWIRCGVKSSAQAVGPSDSCLCCMQAS